MSAAPWLPLVALPLLLRLVPWRRTEDRWRTPVDLGLALCCGLIVLGLAQWMDGFHLRGGGAVGSDFSEYCLSTDAVRDGEWNRYSGNRSALVGWLPGTLARSLGVIGGLRVGAALSTGLIGAGIFLWARSLGGRLAGLLSALFFGAVGPLVLLPRTLSFYPETVAAFVGSAAGAAAAMRWRSGPALLLGGVGTALALSADVRGLFWALPALGLSLLAACVPPDWRRRRAWLWLPLRLALVLGPVALSYPLAGARLFRPDAPTLEAQVAGFQADRQRALGLPVDRRPIPEGYLWGQSDPLEIPETLRALVAMRARIPDAVRRFPETVFGRYVHIEPWYGLIGGALAVAALGLARWPWRLMALAGLLPFFVVLRNTADFLVYLRYLQAPMAAFPVILALAGVSLGFAPLPGIGGGREEPGRWRWADWARPALGLLAAALVVLGVVPSALSPVASWRRPFQANQDIERMLLYARERGVMQNPMDRECLAVLIGDVHVRGE